MTAPIEGTTQAERLREVERIVNRLAREVENQVRNKAYPNAPIERAKALALDAITALPDLSEGEG